MKSKRLLRIFTIASLAIFPSFQQKGPQFPLQDPQPVNFVQDVLSNSNDGYCNVSLIKFTVINWYIILVFEAKRPHSGCLL